MKTAIILNPGARKVDDDTIREVERASRRLGEVTILTSEKIGEARTLARQALDDHVDLVVAAGGDGTLNEVVNGLARDFTRARLGVLPLGTGNDFARSINMPEELDAALDVLFSAQFRKIDVVRATNSGVRYFINMSAGGFSGLVDENLTEEIKASWGPLAYLRSGLQTLPDLTAYRTMIQFDEGEHEGIEAYNIVLANARYVAGGIPVAPQAMLDDGLLDVMIVPVASLTQLMLLLPQILLGEHLDSSLVMFRRARKVSVRSQPGMWINIDGELIGKEPTTFEVLPQALHVITGPQPQGLWSGSYADR